jgi:hypothetical protein
MLTTWFKQTDVNINVRSHEEEIEWLMSLGDGNLVDAVKELIGHDQHTPGEHQDDRDTKRR